MKVLFVYKYLTHGGGCETVIRARLEGLPGMGIEARAWFLHDCGGLSHFAGLEDRVGIGEVKALARFVGEWRPDAVTSFDTEEIFPLFRQRDRPEARLIVEAHSPYLDNLEYLRALADVPVAAVFVPSELQAGLARERMTCVCPVRVVPNPLRTEFTQPVRDLRPAPARPLVLWIGRVEDHKNWQGFLAVAGEAVRSGVNADFIMVGRALEAASTLAARVLQVATERGVGGHLRWYYGLPPGVIVTLFDRARASGGVTVSTSRGESFGMTIAESLARACPVVVPRQGPFTEFVGEGESGLFFNPADPAEAARCIGRVLSDSAFHRALGTAGRAAMLERFAPAPALADLATALGEVSKANPRGSAQRPGE